MDEESSLLPGFTENELKIARLFQPRAYDKTLEAIRGSRRFVHYTTAETALKMLRSREVWMRKSSCMNDFMEIEHGLDCLRPAYKAEKARFQKIFDGMFPGFSQRFEDHYNGWLVHFRSDTYIACISEHDADEDDIGRLSMWRAYGGSTGVAIVVKSSPFLMPSDALKAYTRPVAYLGRDMFAREFSSVLDSISENVDQLKELGEATVFPLVFDMFTAALLCTKHLGFREEREWRIIYCPTYEKSDHIAYEIQTIGGTPQPIYRIPLRDIPDEGLVGIEIPKLVDRLIVGPTFYPSVVREAFVSALEDAGMTDASERVVVSDIPIRQ